MSEPDREADHAGCVLLVDDDPVQAGYLRELLDDLGIEVRVAATGQEAIELAGVHRPRVVLLDVGLPDLHGFAVAAQLREVPGMAGARIVAVTGYPRSPEALEIVGIDGILVKPVELDRLLEAVDGLVPPGARPVGEPATE